MYDYYMKVCLLRSHSAEHLILGVARRSLPYNDVILLGKYRYSPIHIVLIPVL